MTVTQPDSGTSQWKRVDAGYCGRCSSSYKTDIRQPSFEVMPRISVLFGVTVDCLLCRGTSAFWTSPPSATRRPWRSAV